MNRFLVYAYLFYLGSTFGWVLELLFRRFFSASNPERRWINPGFCIGPYVPIYGIGVCLLYGLVSFFDRLGGISPVLLIIIMAAVLTALEYIAGILSLKVMKLRLWDYSGCWGNVQGLICPMFSLGWAALGAVFYFVVYPYALKAIEWLADNLAFSFVIGFFFGVFVIDAAYSAQLVTKIRSFANEHGVIVRYEELKAHIRSVHEKNSRKVHFLFPFISETPLYEHIKNTAEQFEKQRKAIKK